MTQKKTHQTAAPAPAPAPTPELQQPLEHLADEKQKVSPQEIIAAATTTTTTTTTTTKKTVEDVQNEIKQVISTLYHWFLSFRIFTFAFALATGIYEHSITQHLVQSVFNTIPGVVAKADEIKTSVVQFVAKVYDLVTYFVAYSIFTTLAIVAAPNDFITAVRQYLTGAKDNATSLVSDKVESVKSYAHDKVDLAKTTVGNAKATVNEKVGSSKAIVTEKIDLAKAKVDAEITFAKEKAEPYYQRFVAPVVERITALVNKISDLCFKALNIVMNILSPIDREELPEQQKATLLRPRFKNESIVGYTTAQVQLANQTYVVPVYNQIFNKQQTVQQGVNP